MSLILSGTEGLSDVDGSAATPAIRGTDANTGIFFPAADTIAFAEGGAEVARFDSSGNFGLGVTPSAWDSTYKAIQVGARSMFFGIGSEANMANNAYYNSGYKYVATSAAGLYTIDANVHKWYNAASGTAGNAITFTQAMTLDASGNLALGNTTSLSSSSGRIDLTVNGTSSSMVSFGTGGTRRGYALHDATDFTIASETAGSIRFLNNGSERARIDSSGNLLVGTTSGSGKVNIKGGNGNQLYLDNAGEQFTQVTFINNGTPKSYMWWDNTNTRFQIQSGASGGVYLANTGTSWTSVSDERVKDIVESIENATQKLSNWRAVIGKYKTDDEGTRRSFLIAQDVLTTFPEAVDTTNNDEFGLSYQDLIPVLVKAIQEQQALITQLTARISALESA